VQAGQQLTQINSRSRNGSLSKANGPFHYFRVIFLTLALPGANPLRPESTRVKVFLEAFHQLELELGFGQQRP
jgi:hypothetical protein